MALKAVIDQATYDAMPAERREMLYVADPDNAGQYVIDLDEPVIAAGMKIALNRARAELKPHKARMVELTQLLGADRAKWIENFTSTVALSEGGISETEFKVQMELLATDHKSVVAALEAQHAPELAKRDALIAKLEAEHAYDEAMADAGVASPKLLMPHLQKHTRVSDGVITVIDPKSGEPRLLSDGSPVSISELLHQWQTLDGDLSRAFSNPIAWRLLKGGARGGGTGNGHGN